MGVFFARKCFPDGFTRLFKIHVFGDADKIQSPGKHVRDIYTPIKPASNFILLIVPRRYFCGGLFRFMSWCLNFCAVGALCMFSYF